MAYRCPRSGCGREFGSERALAIHTGKAHLEGVQAPVELKSALRALGIVEEDVLSFRIYDDRVVIIEGPGGKKRVWQKPKKEVVRGG